MPMAELLYSNIPRAPRLQGSKAPRDGLGVIQILQSLLRGAGRVAVCQERVAQLRYDTRKPKVHVRDRK